MSLERKLRNIFNGPRKGETYELRNGLVSQYAHERKDAIQRVIAAMTVGKDVSALFPDVLKNISTYDIEQKKLVYLYLMNYAKSHPELCILAVNTFVQDTEDPNPLVRALAIRTMGCIRVDKMVDYMEIPLSRTLKDDNPYVRKTACIGVAKLFDLNPQMCIEQGFLEQLQKMIDDSNPMVVANAVNSLFEIRDLNKDPALKIIEITPRILKNLLAALNECTEWGRITVLTALSDYTSTDNEEASHIIERVTPQLQHANPAVVLSSVKAILHHIDNLPSNEYETTLKKLSAPLISLVSATPEAQYVGLRNIRIILEKYPQILQKEMRVFYCKYNDPLYLKLEKLEIMVRLCNETNYNLLLSELKEYSMEIDQEFVKRSIKAIGQVAIKLEKASTKSINILVDLINQRGEYVVNDTVTVMKDILRRYPSQFTDSIISVINNSFQDLDQPDAIASYIWILGEYHSKFSNVGEKLSALCDSFLEDDSSIQLNSLTTLVKINLRDKSNSYSNQLQKLLNLATTECDNADVRDRAYIYWRLLSADQDLASKIILTKLPVIESTISKFNPVVLQELLSELSQISSVYHKPGYTFIDKNLVHVKKTILKSENLEDLQKLAKDEILSNVKSENLLDFDDEPSSTAAGTSSNGNILDELNDLFSTPIPTKSAAVGNNAIMDLFNQQPTVNTQNNVASPNPDFGFDFGSLNLNGQNNATHNNTPTANTNTKSASNDLLDLF